MKPINENDIFKESIDLMETKLARKLFLANKKLVCKNEEIEKSAAELILANRELAFQYKERGMLAAELILANKELAFQYEEKEKRAAELVIANIELAYQNNEKEKKAVELIIVNRELDFQKLEKEIKGSELKIANKKLIYKTQEKEIKSAELSIANRDLRKAEENQREYIKGLEEMMFITSHKVRQPIANIIGFSGILDLPLNSPEDIKNSVACIKESALSLDIYTRELAAFISNMGEKEKKNNQK